ncbi:MAG: NTP transferase domain-containing protein [Candidatus Doudnabacteria bacterium]|nr:NTP transferase domain-containing protein [Candidatus Doudnabacteria bacterium]
MGVAAIIPAAGWGFFVPGFPKVLEQIGGQTILETVLKTVFASGVVDEVVVVVNPNNYGPQIEKVCDGLPVQIAYQQERTGAAGAVAVALPLVKHCEHILVTYADMPLWRTNTMRELVIRHIGDGATVSMVTVALNGTRRLERYGRVIFDEQGVPLAVFEPDELVSVNPELLERAKTVNPSLYAFDRDWLERYIPEIEPVSKDGYTAERHLPKLIPMAYQQGRLMSTLLIKDETEALGVNTYPELVQAREILAQRQENNHDGGRP